MNGYAATIDRSVPGGENSPNEATLTPLPVADLIQPYLGENIMRHAFIGLAVALLAVPAFGADVSVKDVHICCGKCVKAIDGALGGVDDVSGVNIDKDTGTVTFTAESRRAAKDAVKALAKAGFAGEATSGGKGIPLPKIKVAAGTTSDALEITHVHLCCGKCVEGVQEALKDVKGVSTVEGDTKTGIVKVGGQGIDVRAALEALRKGGFNGKASQ